MRRLHHQRCCLYLSGALCVDGLVDGLLYRRACGRETMPSHQNHIVIRVIRALGVRASDTIDDRSADLHVSRL